MTLINNARSHSHGLFTGRQIIQYHRISPNLRVRSHANTPQQFCSGPHINMAFQHGGFCASSRAKGHLLKSRQFGPILAAG